MSALFFMARLQLFAHTHVLYSLYRARSFGAQNAALLLLMPASKYGDY